MFDFEKLCIFSFLCIITFFMFFSVHRMSALAFGCVVVAVLSLVAMLKCYVAVSAKNKQQAFQYLVRFETIDHRLYQLEFYSNGVYHSITNLLQKAKAIRYYSRTEKSMLRMKCETKTARELLFCKDGLYSAIPIDNILYMEMESKEINVKRNIFSFLMKVF